MLSLPPSVRIYLAAERTDMRLGIDGLVAIVRNSWKHPVFTGHLFAFAGRRGDRIKILFWDRGGFVLVYKRLERSRFCLPAIEPGRQSIQLEATQLAMLLDGIDVRRVPRPVRWDPPNETDEPRAPE